MRDPKIFKSETILKEQRTALWLRLMLATGVALILILAATRSVLFTQYLPAQPLPTLPDSMLVPAPGGRQNSVRLFMERQHRNFHHHPGRRKNHQRLQPSGG